MIDLLTIALTHGLIALAAFRMLSRDDLDRDEPLDKSGRKKGSPVKSGPSSQAGRER